MNHEEKAKEAAEAAMKDQITAAMADVEKAGGEAKKEAQAILKAGLTDLEHLVDGLNDCAGESVPVFLYLLGDKFKQMHRELGMVAARTLRSLDPATVELMKDADESD